MRLAISQGNWEETQKTVEEVAKRARGTQRKKILKLLRYLGTGLVSLPHPVQDAWAPLRAKSSTTSL